MPSTPIRTLAADLVATLLVASCGYDDSPYVPDDEIEPGIPTTPPAPGVPLSPTPVPCDTVVECDDGDACTVDACEAGLCTHTRTPGCLVPP